MDRDVNVFINEILKSIFDAGSQPGYLKPEMFSGFLHLVFWKYRPLIEISGDINALFTRCPQ